MRFIYVGMFGAALGYWEVGAVITFGSMILLALGFLMQDVQSQSEKLLAVQSRLNKLSEAVSATAPRKPSRPWDNSEVS